KYLNGIPNDSRVATSGQFLNQSHITPEKIEKIKQLNAIAEQRGQKLAHMALSWILKDERVTSVLIGASKPGQVTDSIQCLKNKSFSQEELNAIDNILNQ
ncbi:MAG: aldo/keto reductase, partial [Flavobacterium sp.]